MVIYLVQILFLISLNIIIKVINYKQIYRIEEQLLNNYIKIFDENIINIGKYNKLKLLLKISGIWSQCHNKEYGLTFRFFIMNN